MMSPRRITKKISLRRSRHVWACVLFRGACVLGSRVLEGGMCGACVLFGCLLLKTPKKICLWRSYSGGNPPDPPWSQNGHVYFEIPNLSTGEDSVYRHYVTSLSSRIQAPHSMGRWNTHWDLTSSAMPTGCASADATLGALSAVPLPARTEAHGRTHDMST